MVERQDATGEVRFDPRVPHQWFRKHPELKGAIAHTVSTQVANGLFKSKFATTLRWHGHPVLECRVNERSAGAVRVAFALEDGAPVVLFVSGTLQKRAFGTELDRFLRKEQP